MIHDLIMFAFAAVGAIVVAAGLVVICVVLLAAKWAGWDD